jgi:hypothetical protein
MEIKIWSPGCLEERLLKNSGIDTPGSLGAPGMKSVDFRTVHNSRHSNGDPQGVFILKKEDYPIKGMI